MSKKTGYECDKPNACNVLSSQQCSLQKQFEKWVERLVTEVGGVLFYFYKRENFSSVLLPIPPAFTLHCPNRYST